MLQDAPRCSTQQRNQSTLNFRNDFQDPKDQESSGAAAASALEEWLYHQPWQSMTNI
jgi:hypothetical protein